jgi:hypothetical protein
VDGGGRSQSCGPTKSHLAHRAGQTREERVDALHRTVDERATSASL